MKHANGPTVTELAMRFLDDHVAARCKPATAAAYRFAIDKHILPAFGKVSALAVERTQVAAFHEALRDTPVMANQAVDLLARIYRAADDRGTVPAGSNPCRHLKKYRSRRRERFLTEEEFRRLGRVMDEMEANNDIAVPAAAALRLLMLTGCQRNEILTPAPGRGGSGGLGASPRGLQDWRTDGIAVAGGGEAVGRHPPGSGQPLRHCRPRRAACPQPERPLGEGPRAGRPARRAAS